MIDGNQRDEEFFKSKSSLIYHPQAPTEFLKRSRKLTLVNTLNIVILKVVSQIRRFRHKKRSISQKKKNMDIRCLPGIRTNVKLCIK